MLSLTVTFLIAAALASAGLGTILLRSREARPQDARGRQSRG